MSAPNLQLTTSYQTLVTGASGGTANVSLVFCNNSASDVTIDVNVVPDSGTAGDTNQIIDVLTIEAGDSYFFDQKVLLSSGQTIQAKASAATSITATASYLDL